MDVAVHHTRAQRLLRSVSGTTVLGSGLLERVRATSLGLLGATAAVGLTIVALAFNQAWPLVAGAPIPSLPVQGAGKARVAAGSGGERRLRSAVGDSAGSPRADGGGNESASGAAGGFASPSRPSPAPTDDVVVAPATPAPSAVEGGNGGGEGPQPVPAEPDGGSPTPVQSQPAAQVPPAPPPEATQPEPPPATVSEAPDDSYVPSWSNGKGHAYGRSGESPGNGHDE